MRLSPLVLSVRESGRTSGCAQSSCPFCGVRFAEGQEPFVCPDGSEDFSCAPCHLVRHLERDTIAEEAVLIWLPEMTQAALNALAHGALIAPGATPARSTGRRIRSLGPHQDVPNGAIEAIRALETRRFEAEARLGTSSPRVLARGALAGQAQSSTRIAPGCSAASDFVPRGRFFVDGEDIYPQLIAERGAAVTTAAVGRQLRAHLAERRGVRC